MRRALANLERSLREPTDDSSGLLAIRGSIHRLSGPWALGRAIADYWTVLALRERSGAPVTTIGEALSELGYAYVLALRPFRGIALMEEGVRLLARGPESGFLLRARRKLEAGYRVTGSWRRARAEAAEVTALAERLAAFDQARR